MYVSTGPLLANNVDLNLTVKSDLRHRITGDYLFAEDTDYDSANPGNKIKAAEKISSDYGQGSAIYTFEGEVSNGLIYLDNDYLLVTTYDQVKTFIGKDIYDHSYAAICDGYASEETDDGVFYEPILLDNETLDAFNKVTGNKLEIGDVVPMKLFFNSQSLYDYRYVLVDTFSVNFQPSGSSIEDHFPAVIKQESFDNQLERTSVVDWSMYDELEKIDEDIRKLGDQALKDEVSSAPIIFNKVANIGYPLIPDSSDSARPEKYFSYVGVVDPNSSLTEDNWVMVPSAISTFYSYLFFQNFVNDNYQPDVSSSVREYLETFIKKGDMNEFEENLAIPLSESSLGLADVAIVGMYFTGENSARIYSPNIGVISDNLFDTLLAKAKDDEDYSSFGIFDGPMIMSKKAALNLSDRTVSGEMTIRNGESQESQTYADVIDSLKESYKIADFMGPIFVAVAVLVLILFTLSKIDAMTKDTALLFMATGRKSVGLSLDSMAASLPYLFALVFTLAVICPLNLYLTFPQNTKGIFLVVNLSWPIVSLIAVLLLTFTVSLALGFLIHRDYWKIIKGGK